MQTPSIHLIMVHDKLHNAPGEWFLIIRSPSVVNALSHPKPEALLYFSYHLVESQLWTEVLEKILEIMEFYPFTV